MISDLKKLQLENNISIAYSDEGNGEQTILFIHGLASSSSAWKHNTEELKKHYRCIAIDLPGYGHSSKDYYTVNLNWYSDIIHAFCHKLGLDNIVLAGHSMGGQISVILSHKYPGLVQRLILVAPAGFESYSFLQKKLIAGSVTPQTVHSISDEQIRHNMRLNFFNMPAGASAMIDDRIQQKHTDDFKYYCHIVPQCIKAMVNEPVWEMLPKLKQETLVIFGKEDRLIPNPFFSKAKTETVAQAGAARIPSSTLLIIPEAGHFVMFEKYAEFNSAVVSFLK